MPTLTLGPSVDGENQLDRVGRRNLLVRGLHHRELMPVLRLELLDHHLGFLDLRGIKLAFYRQAYLAVLERVENVGFADGFKPVVFDPADDRPLDHVEDDDFGVGAVGTVLHFEANILEILRVPQRLEIAPQARLRCRVAGAGEDPRLQGFAADAPVSVELDAIDDRRGLAREQCWRGAYRLAHSGAERASASTQASRHTRRTDPTRATTMAGLFACGRRKCQGRAPQAKIVRSPPAPRGHGLWA